MLITLRKVHVFINRGNIRDNFRLNIILFYRNVCHGEFMHACWWEGWGNNLLKTNKRIHITHSIKLHGYVYMSFIRNCVYSYNHKVLYTSLYTSW